MNTVREHRSAIKGGRLAVAAHPAPVLSLLISDVPGDDPGVIASGDRGIGQELGPLGLGWPHQRWPHVKPLPRRGGGFHREVQRS